MSLLFPLAIAALILTAMLASMHLVGAYALNPAWRMLDGPAYVTVKQAADKTFPRIAKPLMLATLGVTAAVVAVSIASGERFIALLAALTLLALIGTLVAILRGDLPINREMATWQASAMPVDWRETVRRWERFFEIRVVTTVVALAGMTTAVLTAG